MLGLALLTAAVFAQQPKASEPAAAVEADEPSAWHAQLWFPVTLGASLGAEASRAVGFGFAAGIRPTLVFGTGVRSPHDWPRLGVFAEVGTASGDVHSGGGLSFSPLEFVTFEAGVDARRSPALDWGPQLVASVFLGPRSDVDFLGASIGLRIDGRLGLGPGREAMVVASVSFDPVGTITGIVVVTQLVGALAPKQ